MTILTSAQYNELASTLNHMLLSQQSVLDTFQRRLENDPITAFETLGETAMAMTACQKVTRFLIGLMNDSAGEFDTAPAIIKLKEFSITEFETSATGEKVRLMLYKFGKDAVKTLVALLKTMHLRPVPTRD